MIKNEGPQVVSPRLSGALNARLRELKFTRSDFIRKFHRDHGDKCGARNHLFKILNGQVFVGMEKDELLPMICKTLNLDYEKMKQLVITDRIDNKDWAHAVPKLDSDTQQLVAIMDTLPPKERRDVLEYAKLRAKLRS